jgi:hypothetical protein
MAMEFSLSNSGQLTRFICDSYASKASHYMRPAAVSF